MIKAISVSLVSSFYFLSMQCFAAWELSGQASSLHFVTTKAVHVAEVHEFKRLSGNINDAGSAMLEIDLSSVDTKIEIRDQRMRDMLFEINLYPKAVLTTTVPSAALQLNSGEQTSVTLDGELAIHGMKHKIVGSVASVSKLANGQLVAESQSPIVINASNLGLVEGIEKLREVAGLPNISHSVIVNYRLVFEQK